MMEEMTLKSKGGLWAFMQWFDNAWTTKGKQYWKKIYEVDYMTKETSSTMDIKIPR